MTSATEFGPEPGKALTLEPGLRMVLAPNPSPMTGAGTNSYIVGQGSVAVIDPGPARRDHLDAIIAALEPGERVSHILVTHSHLDHSPLARPLAEATGAPVLAFGPATAGRSALMNRLARDGLTAGGEGIDSDFRPDECIKDGDLITGNGWRISVLHTPGHFGNHLCFLWRDTAFSGDHVMGWASSLVSPPDGDMGAYMASLDRLAASGAVRLYPGHGAPVPEAAGRIAELVAHRKSRESAVLAALAERPSDAQSLAARIYTDTPPALMPAAARNVLAHLLDLMDRKQVEPLDKPGAGARFRLI